MNSTDLPTASTGSGSNIEETVLTSAAAVTQDFKPLKSICAHINGFHVYADDPKRLIETNHYCCHVNNDIRQCLLYDSAEAGARLIGIEYMITPEIFEALPENEQKLWHSHVYEVKSGVLILPNSIVPDKPWSLAEKREMEHPITLYGKTYHLWQTDRGDKVPLGEPKLMASLTSDSQLDMGKLNERDARFKVDYKKKKAIRQDIAEPAIHPNADRMIASK